MRAGCPTGTFRLQFPTMEIIIIDNQTLLQQAAAVIEDNPMKINKFAAGAPVLVAVVEEPALLMNNTVPIAGRNLIWEAQPNTSVCKLPNWDSAPASWELLTKKK